MNKNKVTIIIATRNRAQELNMTLETLQFLHPDTPIIVVDNASTDETCTLVKKQQIKNRMISLIRLPRNLGAVARNHGVKAAKTTFVAFNDDDSYWAFGAFQKAELLFETYPTLGGIAGRILIGSEKKEDPINRLLQNSPIQYKEKLPGPPVLGFLACGCIIRVNAFLQAGGFNPILHFRGGEKLLAMDMASSGWPVCYINNIIAHHFPSRVRPDKRSALIRELRNGFLTTWLRRPAKICFRETLSLLKKGVHNQAYRQALLETFYKIPSIIYHRRLNSQKVENNLILLEKKYK